MSEEIKMDADYFIKKFSKIASKRWCIGKFIRGGQRCALGHCGARRKHDTDEGNALMRIFNGSVTLINDGINPNYSQRTPKARIMAALENIKTRRTA